MIVPALHSTLRPEAIAAVVNNDYQLGRDASCAVWHRGFNDYYLVEAPAGRFVLRVYATDKYWMPGESDVRFELDLLAHLHAAGLPVVAPAERRDGEVLGMIEAPEGRRYCALFAFAPGGPKQPDADNARALGGICARLHNSASGFVTTHHRYHLDADLLLEMPVREVTAFLGGSRDEDLRVLRILADSVREQIETIPKREPFYGVIHADLHGGNCHWVNGAPTVLDFDHCGYGWRAYDIAYCLRHTGPQYDRAAERIRAAVIEGYNAIRPISEAEYEMLRTLGRAAWIREGTAAGYGLPPTTLVTYLRDPYELWH